MSDDDYRALQQVLVAQPDRGDLIPGSGGLRKVRWRLTGRGKRGGVRVIYYWLVPDAQLRMLLVYEKAVQEDLTAAQLRALQSIIAEWDNG